MKALVLGFIIVLTTSFATAGPAKYDLNELTDAALIADVEAIAAELEASNHDQEIMNMAFNRSRVIRKKLNFSLPKVGGLDDATDDDILPLLQDVVTSLETFAHRVGRLNQVKRHLNKILVELVDNREVSNEIGILTLETVDQIDFGGTFPGTALLAVATIKNSGTGGITSLTPDSITAPFSYVGGNYPGNGGTCQQDLAPEQTCRLLLQFIAPNLPGVVSGQVDLLYFDGVSEQSFSIDLTAEVF